MKQSGQLSSFATKHSVTGWAIRERTEPDRVAPLQHPGARWFDGQASAQAGGKPEAKSEFSLMV